MEQLNSAITIQEALMDVPHEKLKSLLEEKEICAQLNAPEASSKELHEKILKCETEMAQEKKCNNRRLEQIMDIANSNAS